MSRKKSSIPAALQKRLNKDPFGEREAEQYENPLPSREFVLKVMEEHGVPVYFEVLCDILDISETEHDNFQRRISAMERDGQIMRNRKGALCIAEKINIIAGRVVGHPEGFGFFIPDDKHKYHDEYVLSSREMEQVMHGDRVMIRPAGTDRRGRPEAKIVEVLERVNQTLVGRVIRAQGLTIVAAEDKRIHHDILVPYHLDMNAKDGQIVMVELTLQPSQTAKPMGKVVEILGNYADPGMEIEIALRKHRLPHVFSPATIQQAEKLSPEVTAKNYKGRRDIRDLMLVTIDGETARDFDDAVYAQPEGRGWRLIVAIADVSYYVKPGEPLDKDAYDRGNSVYFPRRVIPMLPEALSNGLCSLKPEVDRLCMVCDMHIDILGKIKRYEFYPSVMHSRARMTYTKVHDILTNPDGELAKEYDWLAPNLRHLHDLYKVLVSAREKRGAIEFESSDTLMMFNEHGKIEQIVPVVRNEAHRLIEECMLAANVCAANFLLEHEHPALYRVHEGPSPEKLEVVRAFMADFGFTLGGGDTPHAKDYGRLIKRFKGRPDEQLLQTVLLRSMQQAVYSPDNVGHFGLAYEAYTHFTSPIRRYPDLLVHRAIKAVLDGAQYKAGPWDEIGQHCSMTERRADDATRDVESWLKCFYMQDKVGEEYDGTVAGVTGFGLFVALDGVYVEGLLHVTDLGNDYFVHDKSRHAMVGERTGVMYRLGDRLRVKVVRVDMETSKIDFTLVKAIQSAPSEGSQANDSSAPRSSQSSSKHRAAVGTVAANTLHLPKQSSPFNIASTGRVSKARSSSSKNTRGQSGSAKPASSKPASSKAGAKKGPKPSQRRSSGGSRKSSKR